MKAECYQCGMEKKVYAKFGEVVANISIELEEEPLCYECAWLIRFVAANKNYETTYFVDADRKVNVIFKRA